MLPNVVVCSNSAMAMFGVLRVLILKHVSGYVLRMEDFEGRILVADDSICLSVFHP